MSDFGKKSPFAIIQQNSNLYKAFVKNSTVKQFQKGEMIYLQDDHADTFYLIKSGRVRLFLTSKEGNELTIEVLGANQIFGESSYFGDTPRLTSVDTITDVELFMVEPKHLLFNLSQDPKLMMELFALMAQRINFLSIQVYSMNFLSAEKKVAHILVQLGSYFKIEETDSTYAIDYTHQEISRMIGIARVTTTKVLQTFAERGWVFLEYRKIKVLDEKALTAFLLKE